MTDHIQQVTTKTYSPKTLANKKSQVRKILKKPILSAATLKEIIEEFPENVAAEFKQSLNLKTESDCMVKIVTEVIHNLKSQFGHKSEVVIQVINILAHHIERETVTDIMKSCKINFENAKKVKDHKKLSRKVYKKKITQEIVDKIEQFYVREDISRVNTKVKSKKLGPVYNMNFSVKEAYIVFKSENLEIQVSYSKFNLF